MTTVAWDGKTIAADKLTSTHCGVTKKLVTLKDGSVAGRSGDSAFTILMAKHLNGECEKPHHPDPANGSSSLLVCRLGKAYRLDCYQVPLPILEPFYAIGSGADYAMGAMAMGATAEEAVAIAARFDQHTGNGIDIVDLKDNTRRSITWPSPGLTPVSMGRRKASSARKA